ncbi:hypothetical protein EIP86_001608 [Pleurotus ostreatoroseus]|nr:hypothetical protein EIP86_001608 [Pleurotus ostreatoroseus]
MFAAAYVQNGAKVYIASRKEKQLRESKAGCDALAAAIKQKEDKIHILINNSGATWGAPYDDFPEKEGWDRVLSLNVKAVFYLTSALTELLAKGSTADDPGRVINISSVAAISTVATESLLAGSGNGLWSYNTSKAAVNHLTLNLASTLAPRYITVNAVMPGIFPSKMTAYGYKSQGSKGIAAGQPMGRTGMPRDMAGVALFLASPASAHVTGAQIPLDGGAWVSRTKAAL